MQSTIYPNNISANIENYGIPTLKLEVKLTDHKLIPNYSWVNHNISMAQPHNPFGPAFVSDTMVLWYIHGCIYNNTKLFCQHAKHDDETTLNWYLVFGDTLPSSLDQMRYLPVSLKDNT